VLLAAGLAGCALQERYTNHPSNGGRTSDAVGAALEAVPGIEHADAYTAPWYNPGEGGLFSSTGVDLVLWVTIDPEMHVADSAGFLRATAEAAWSINDGYSPQGRVNLIVRRGLDRDHDWAADAASVFGDDVQVSRDPDIAFMHYENEPTLTDDDTLVSLSVETYRRTLGDWPAAPADFDAALLAEGPPEDVDPPAVDDFHTAGITGGGETCISVGFTRNLDADGVPYPGDVTITLFVRDREYGTAVAHGSASDDAGGESSVSFCGDDAPTNDVGSVHSRVVAPAAPGFRGVDRGGVTNDW